MKTILLTVLSLLFLGCVMMPPKQIQGFKTGNYNINTICTDKSVDETHSLLFSALKECYNTGMGTFVQSREIGDIKQLVLKNIVGIRGEFRLSNFKEERYSNLVEIHEGNSSCKTSVDIYEPNFTPINDRSSRIKKWLKGEKVTGCGLY